METRANYALIGAFVILAAVTALGFTLWLGQSQFQREFDEYDIVFDGPVSLEEGAAVRYIGIKVGEVQTVRIDRADSSKVRARVRIDAQTPVKTDSTALIDFAGITGVTFVQINAGGPNTALLEREPGQPVPEIRSVQSGVGAVVQSVGEIMSRTDRLLSDDNIENFSATLANLQAITAKLAEEEGAIENAAETLAAINRATAAFEKAAGSLGSFGEEADQRIADFGDQFAALVTEVEAVMKATDRLVTESSRAASAAADAVEGPAKQALEDTSAVSADLRRLIERLDRLARDLEENPQSFILGAPAPYEERRR